MNLHIGGGGSGGNNSSSCNGDLTYEDLWNIQQYRDNENKTIDAYELSNLLARQLSDLDIRIQESEFNSASQVSPRRGYIDYDSLLDSGVGWFSVEFREVTDILVLKAETAFIDHRSNGFFGVDPENVWIMLSPALNSKTNRSQNFSVVTNSNNVVSVNLISESSSTKFFYVLTPVAHIGNRPVRLISITS